jgi:hypothetical protein
MLQKLTTMIVVAPMVIEPNRLERLLEFSARVDQLELFL